MPKAELDPIIAKLADPQILAKIAGGLARYHRPVVESFDLPSLFNGSHRYYRPYDIYAATADALTKRSIEPTYSPALVHQVAELALKDFPNYEAIAERRSQMAEKLEQEHTTRG